MKREPDIAGREARPPARGRAGDRVSEAANRLFYERGIRAVGIEEIVAEAGVTKPSLYRSYASKDALVCACLKARFDEIMAKIDAAEAAHSGDPLGAIRAIIASGAADLADPAYRGCPITNAAVEFPEPDHPARLIALDFKRMKRERLGGMIARLPTSDPEGLTDSLSLLFEGAYAIRHTSCINGPARALERAANALLDGFLNAEAGVNEPSRA